MHLGGLQKRLLESLPKPGFGTKCPKVICLRHRSLSLLFLFVLAVRDTQQMVDIGLNRHGLPHFLLRRAALQFMQEQSITEYDQLSAKAEDAVSRFHTLTEQLRQTEADLSATSELMGAVVRYAKTRPVFDGYKAAKYSRKYLAEYEAELADYRAAKATMGELLGGEKLPKMEELKEKRRQLAARKKALYTEYRSAQEEMRQAVAVKANIDHLLGVPDGQRKKEQER